MMRSVLFLLGLLAAGIASAQSVAALGDLTFAADADHFDIFRARAGGLFNYKSYLDYVGVAAQDTHYSQSGWSRDAPGVIGVWRNQRRDTLAGVNAEAGVVRIGARPRFVADATWGLRPLPGTGVELIAARDLVETQRALDRGTTYGFLGASVEQTIIDRLTVVEQRPVRDQADARPHQPLGGGPHLPQPGHPRADVPNRRGRRGVALSAGGFGPE